MLRIPANIDLDVLLLAGRAVFLVFSFVIATVAFTRWRRTAERGAREIVAHTAVVLERLASVQESIAATDTRIAEFARRLEGENRHAATASHNGPSYQIAIRLARSGATREELVASCGLTRQEAELVQRLHATPRAAGRKATVAVA